MPYDVPQFIEVEDKIFGPLTFKQFLYLAGGAGVSYLAWILIPPFFAMLLVVLFGGLALALAFYKVNDQPFITMVENAFRYLLEPKLYVWKKEEPKQKKQAGKAEIPTPSYVPKLSESKLRDLSWGLDVQENLYSGVEPAKKAKEEKIFTPENRATIKSALNTHGR